MPWLDIKLTLKTQSLIHTNVPKTKTADTIETIISTLVFLAAEAGIGGGILEEADSVISV